MLSYYNIVETLDYRSREEFRLPGLPLHPERERGRGVNWPEFFYFYLRKS